MSRGRKIRSGSTLTTADASLGGSVRNPRDTGKTTLGA